MKLGLLGGTFNPVHNAHLRIAAAAQRACGLERIIFIPAADPPHKPLAGDVSFEHRAAMVRLAIAGQGNFELSLLEGERGGKSYSIDTIQSFRQSHRDDRLFFIIGGDSFLEIGTWHRYLELLAACSLIVVERPGCRIADPLAALPEEARSRYHREGSNLHHQSGTTITCITGAPLALSSTEIRQCAARGDDLSQLVPGSVAAYISQQRIYH